MLKKKFNLHYNYNVAVSYMYSGYDAQQWVLMVEAHVCDLGDLPDLNKQANTARDPGEREK